MTVDLPGGHSVTSTFEHVYEEHLDQLVRTLVLAGSTVGDAEDAAQEAFARALVRWPQVHRGSSPAGYVYRTAFRIVGRTRQRDRRRAVLDTSDRPRDYVLDGSDLVLRAAMADLPRRQRECLLLRFFIGWTTAEIAAGLRVRESTVRTHIEKGRLNLADLLKA